MPTSVIAAVLDLMMLTVACPDTYYFDFMFDTLYTL